LKENAIRVLVLFNAGAEMYGMERAVIETFDLLRPEVEPHFLMSYTTMRLDLPILREITNRGMNHSFFSDSSDWPRIGRPRSLRELWRMVLALILGNRDVLKAARGKDIIYFPGVSYFSLAAVATAMHRLQRRRVIYQFHNLVARSSKGLRFVGTFVTDFVHNTGFGYSQVTAGNSWLSKRRNSIIPLTVGVPLSEGLRKQRDEELKGGRHILFVGQAAKHKGMDLLLDAFLTISESHDQIVTLHILGGCNDPILRQKLEQLGCNNSNVKYWGYRDDVNEFLKRADLLIQPSRLSTNESFGRSVVEAMAAGVPCVSFRSGALQELVIHEETGLLCEDESARCLADNIIRLLADNNLRTRCGARAKRTYEELYSGDRVKSMWLQFIQNPIDTDLDSPNRCVDIPH
jgi:glycosyltransferase involved in cell wall biosynthesis